MIRLRPYKACDADIIASWIKDEVTFRKWCADRYDSYPISGEDINSHYDSMAYSDSFYQMTAFDESGVVGHLIMRFTDEQKSVLRFGFIIVDDSRRGEGLGRQMLELAVRYAFDILKAKKVTLGVFKNNEQAYRCYKAVGFKEVKADVTEHYEIFGERWDCIELELLK
ncbi:MAG: GNAT family N-acetyltransferase [Ruminococcus sp.]|nr:GNAT family N-acetyltransferase [Ruminococcus sp.]